MVGFFQMPLEHFANHCASIFFVQTNEQLWTYFNSYFEPTSIIKHSFRAVIFNLLTEDILKVDKKVNTICAIFLLVFEVLNKTVLSTK